MALLFSFTGGNSQITSGPPDLGGITIPFAVVTPADQVIIQDTDDADAMKHVTVQDILDLSSPGSPTVQTVLKPADESVVSSTVFQDDDDLVLPVLSNTNYLVDIWLSIQCSSNVPDLKCQLSAPAGTTLLVGWIMNDDTAASDSGILRAGATSSGIIVIRNNNASQVRLTGPVRVGGTAGTLQLQWAQNSANGNPTIVEADSWMRLEEL